MKRIITLLSCVLLFSMNANAQACYGDVLISEDFESGLPSGWSDIDLDGLSPCSATWTTTWRGWTSLLFTSDPTNSFLGNISDYCSPPGQADDYLITPLVMLGLSPCLSFMERSPDFSGNGPSGFEVRVSTTTADAAGFQALPAIYTQAAGSSVFSPVTVDLSTYAGQNVYLAFWDNSTSKDIIAIDDVTVTNQYAVDMTVTAVDLAPYIITSTTTSITGTLVNAGTTTITSFELNWSDDGCAHNVQNVTGVTLNTGDPYPINHTTSWTPTVAASYLISVWASNINGGLPDDFTANDKMDATITVVDDFVTRMLMHEDFTGSTCPPCLPGAQTLDPIMADNFGTTAAITAYQMSWPTSPPPESWKGDPYFTLEGDARKNYYSVTGIPDMYYGGTKNMNPASYSQGLLDAEQAVPAFINLTSTFEVVGQTINVDVTIDPIADFPSSDLRAFIAVNEFNTVKNVRSNGQTEFFHVMKKMLPSENGTVIGSLTSGTPVTISETWEFQGSYRLPYDSQDPITHAIEHSVEQFSDLEVVIWIQDYVTKQIHQSAVASKTTGISGQPAVSSDFIGIYPNPSSRNAFITYKLLQAQRVGLEVYNVLGEMVYSEYKGMTSAGTYKDQINVQNLSDGVYLVKLGIDNAVYTKKLTVRK